MAKVLTVRNAEIHTAAVEIQTLTLSGRQVTLAVFRQLQEEPLIDGDGKFRGLPWGRVNYHADKCANGHTHLHVVWQRETELRRAYVEKPLFGGFYFPRQAGNWLKAAVLRGGRPSDEFFEKRREWRHYVNRKPELAASPGAIHPMVEGFHIRIRYGQDVADTWRYQQLSEVYPDETSYKEEYQRKLAVLRGQVEASGASEASLLAQVIEACKEEQQRRAFLARWQELCAMPQIFIAV